MTKSKQITPNSKKELIPNKMPEQQIQQDPTSALLSEFSTRLNEVEEKQRLIKDRVMLIGKNLISTKEEYEKQTIDFRKHFSEIDFEINSLKQLNKRIINELGTLARKTELKSLQKQMKMFEPMEIARIKDIKKIVREELKKGVN